MYGSLFQPKTARVVAAMKIGCDPDSTNNGGKISLGTDHISALVLRAMAKSILKLTSELERYQMLTRQVYICDFWLEPVLTINCNQGTFCCPVN